MARSTRESILTAATELMRQRGYAAFAMKDVVAGSGAPIGSLYHHFPGGKVQLAREALVNAGVAYGQLIPTLVAPHDELGEAIERMFAQAADDMATTGYANMCPVASVAAEVADTIPELREATAEIFASWLSGGTEYFVARGLARDVAREVTVAIVGALEGAFVLARTLRSKEPLLVAGRSLAPRFRGVALAPVDAQPRPLDLANPGS